MAVPQVKPDPATDERVRRLAEIGDELTAWQELLRILHMENTGREPVETTERRPYGPQLPSLTPLIHDRAKKMGATIEEWTDPLGEIHHTICFPGTPEEGREKWFELGASFGIKGVGVPVTIKWTPELLAELERIERKNQQ